MAHFAEIDQNNKVIRVLVIPDSEQHRGQQYLAVDLLLGGTWVQTSYNNNFRKQYAGTGFSYDPAADVFITPKPFPSWTLNAHHDWQAPVAQPVGAPTRWDEATLTWVAI